MPHPGIPGVEPCHPLARHASECYPGMSIRHGAWNARSPNATNFRRPPRALLDLPGITYSLVAPGKVDLPPNVSSGRPLPDDPSRAADVADGRSGSVAVTRSSRPPRRHGRRRVTDVGAEAVVKPIESG